MVPQLSIERIHDVRNQAYLYWSRGASNRCRKMFFGPSGARILPIEMILNVSDNRMCFDRERRIVLTEANFVTCVDRDCAFHGYCPMDEHIVPQRDCHRAASLSYDECGKGLHDEVPARGRVPSFAILMVSAERAGKKWEGGHAGFGTREYSTAGTVV
jgi:hypothetical protein